MPAEIGMQVMGKTKLFLIKELFNEYFIVLFLKFQDLLGKDGYPTPMVMKKAINTGHYSILADIIQFCLEKKDLLDGRSNYNYLINIFFSIK